MSDAPHRTTNRPGWQQRLEEIVSLMRETSRQRDPQAMVAAYAARMQRILPGDRRISLSRRGLDPPKYRITRFSGWKEHVNPWKQSELLPILDGGLLGELLYADQPRIIDDLQISADDPTLEYLRGQRSLMAIPLFDEGIALNMVVITRAEPAAFDREQLPDLLWTSNLFGRATQNLVLADQVREAYEVVDRELQVVGHIQRTLLPAQLPDIPTMTLAAHYQTSQRAGGDYYDFFPLSGGKWGILIADVSGHGTPAAVMMAVAHSIAHMYPGDSDQPGDLLRFLNDHLTARYATDVGGFITAFYAIYDPALRTLSYSSAGHNPPLVKPCGRGPVTSLDAARGLPLGVAADQQYDNATHQLQPGDQIVFYTDGITEATDPKGKMFGNEQLDRVLNQCRDDANAVIEAILAAVDEFTAASAATDDRTIVVAKIH
jgi:sigma-B regulation protein RsbU (phosphoserine phosphatase)